MLLDFFSLRRVMVYTWGVLEQATCLTAAEREDVTLYVIMLCHTNDQVR